MNRPSQKFEEKVALLAAMDHLLPGVAVVHNLQTLSVEYISPTGLAFLNTTMEALREMGPRYHEVFFNPEESAEYVPKIVGLLERNDADETVSFFQQARAIGQEDWYWFFSTVRIFHKDAAGKPQYIVTIATHVDPMQHITTKMNRLLEENIFLRRNAHLFGRLTPREQEVLRYWALGKSSAETAELLVISFQTVDTHRKSIKRKLSLTNSYEITTFAQAFDLI
jgi:DNA-binding CsgD family transcriptional regulator